MFAGDFNLPDICWEYGPELNWRYQKFKTSSAYGYENNSSFLDILNNFVLRQQVKEPTRSTLTLNVVLSSVFTTTTHF